ncbi:MAG: DUF2063 domain-containing protein [Gammaproteobacteria bacterium HGW-Gammaproteobacteria-3]|nr:MAG: DUF2063 domain-containing protein [Gammaproteobacteria bacterium HGW-Gammaproteobacteria-3]
MSQATATPSANDPLPAFQAYQQQFIDYVRDPAHHADVPDTLPPSIEVYARLLHNKIDASLRLCFPVSHELLGDTCWRQLVQSFIKHHHCQSPLYREIPDEFIAYLLQGRPPLTVPDFLTDLAHYEWMELVLETALPAYSDEILPIQDNLLTRIPAPNPVLHLLRYRYPVSDITPSDDYWKSWQNPTAPYPHESIILAGLRGLDDRAQFIQINTVTARLTEILQERLHTGEQALLQLAAEMHYSDPKTILPFGSDILAQLAAQQVIIGILKDS